MADPLSVAASIVALLTLTETVLTSCYRYVGQVNNAAADVDRVIRETGGLKVILLDLKGLVDEDGASRLSSLCGENGALTSCIQSLQELESRLLPAARPMSLRRRLLWPFESKKVDEILSNIQKQKPTLSLALIGQNLRATHAVQDSFEQSHVREEREKVLNWLWCTDPTVKHLASRRLHQPGSNHWVLESNAFKGWKQNRGHTLWLHGIPGAGKTIICSTVIDHMEGVCKTQSGMRMAYYYFDFNDENALQLGVLLRSVLLQLSRQKQSLSDHLRSLYERCDNGRNLPGDELLASALFEILDEGEQTFVVIDALDECPQVERDRFYELVVKQIRQWPGRCNFLVTSRSEPDIEGAMTEIDQLHNLPIQTGDVDADVGLHVHQFILGNQRLKKWSEELRGEIETAMVKGSQGMFRWAACQLELIKNCLQAGAVRKTLKNLPRTLEETYDRILLAIPEDRREIARAALLLLAYSMRPLTLSELAEGMVIDVEGQCFDPKEHRLNDHRDVLEVCSSLVTVAKARIIHTSSWMKEKNEIERRHAFPDPYVEVVQFAHFSVKEYMVLQGPRVGARPTSFYLSNAIAHRHIAASSLIYLLDFGEGARVDHLDFEAFPFLAYAARYWHEHWRRQHSSGDQESVDTLMRRLFDSSEPNPFINFLNICNPESLADSGFPLRYSNTKSLDALPPPLYYTAQLGHYELSEWLLEGEGCGVNVAKGTFGPPLQIAALSGHSKIVKLLLDHGADVSALYGEYGSALQAAAFTGREHIVRVLLDHGADVNALGGRFNSALIAACHQGHLATAKVLLDAGANTNIASQHHGKAFNVAASTGKMSLVRLLLQSGVDINDPNGDEGSALYAAAEKGNLDTVKMLVNAGADVNLISGSMGTALQAACSGSGDGGGSGKIKVVEFLLKNGADCNIHGGNYGDALQACVEAGNVESSVDTLHLLLDHGADINYQGGIYHSAMRAAVFTGNDEAAHALLDRGVRINDEIFLQAIEGERATVIPRILGKGVNVNAQNKDGTALQLAILNKDTDTTVSLLQDPSVDINAKGKEGQTALHCAVKKNDQALVTKLLDRGADVNADGGSFGHCLCIAAWQCNGEMVRLLLARGANVNAHGKGYYGTPLIAAIEVKDDGITDVLLSHGADVNARGRGYRNPLETAASKGNETLVKLLLDRGADVNAPPGSDGSCLEYAIRAGNADLARLLIRRGANIVSRGELVDTGGPGKGGPLLAAIKTRQHELVSLLIGLGADVNAIGEQYYGTLLQTAIRLGDEESVRLLLNNGADINMTGGHNGCALNDAILNRNMVHMVQNLLDAGADVNLQGGYCGCPLAAAVQKSNLPLVEQLLDLGADINAPAGIVGSTLQLAAIEGDLEIFRLLLSYGADVNFEGGSHGSALAAAARRDHDTILKELLEHGADPTLGDSIALVAAARNRSDKAISILLGAGPGSYSQNGILGRVLIEAACSGSVAICKALLDRGADVNAIGGAYGNALQAALGGSTVYTNVQPVVALLLEHGADVNLPPSEKFTSALQAALDQRRVEFMGTLLGAGAEVNAHDPRFGTALTVAAELRNPTYVRDLLARGADPHLEGGKYGTPLQAAAFFHRPESITLLLSHNVNPNQLAGKYGCALQAACLSEAAETTINLLFDHGASINIRGGKYETALQCAAKHGHLETVKLLLDRGADPGIEGGKYGSAMGAAIAKDQYHVANFLRRHIEGMRKGPDV
ncbi:MAG: hypothetical protein M1839_003506 [Geoglossum umbratile]|nr:MAG: hypothetical protein M1839_003506 [Geoglossum umbratile]